MLSTQAGAPEGATTASIRDFAVTLFGRYGVAIEIISMQLLFAVIGALYLGRRRPS
jgi:NADH-quinone oxidoreductase subunit J